jgi:uncharacterized protein YdeI (YjbR/CyaY-like superfamily)
MEILDPKSRRAWRKWLERNHAKSAGVKLVLYKKCAQGLRYEEAVEEALCFGWIDGRTNSLDERCYLVYCSPRKPRSAWAQSNKDRVERLTSAGLMTQAGLAKIRAAKEDGSWNALDKIDSLALPADLAGALEATPTRRTGFEGFSKSVKKGLLAWILSAKRPETRAKRIAHVVMLAGKGMRTLQPEDLKIET